jgi:tetratricopeptide (TPR) repeat protein
VRIESPEEEILLEADLIIPLSVVALDDYGISRMTLTYACPAETATVDVEYRGKTQARSEFAWDVAQLDVFPGDAVTYYVSVADNDALTGPKYARTEVYVARVPTIYDLYNEIEDQQEEDLEYLEDIAEEAGKLEEDFNDLIEDMKRDREMDWEEEQSIKQSLSAQDEVTKKLEDAAASMDRTLEMMSDNRLVNFEVIEKMEEIRRLLSEVATAEMREAMEQLRQAMEKLSPEEIRSAMQNLNLTQEELLRKLDMAIEMLKRLQAQQRMEAALNLAKQMGEGQEQVNEMLREGGDLSDAERKQGELLGDTQRLEEMLQELSDLLKEQENPLAQDIEKAGEFMKSAKIGESMSMGLSAMSSGDSQQALGHGENAGEGLSQLTDKLQAARDTLLGEERKQVMEAMTKAMNALRDVSRKQEDALSEMGTGPDVRDSELARREMVFKEALDVIASDLFEVARKSLFVSPMLGRAVLQIGDQVGSASGLLSEGKRARASSAMKASLGQMNELVTGLMDAMEKASSCSSPSGLCDAFQGLENMCCMQMGINQGTQNLLGQGEQGLTMEARAEMARLAAEQQQVAKGIEDLAREFGGRNEILGRLDDLAEEARQIIEDLRRQRVSDETLRRQERILTRLLNAQKSLRRRDYSERRKSRPGEDYQIGTPPPLSLGETERLMQDLLYRKRGYYPPEYEALIRAYFKAISSRRTSE